MGKGIVFMHLYVWQRVKVLFLLCSTLWGPSILKWDSFLSVVNATRVNLKFSFLSFYFSRYSEILRACTLDLDVSLMLGGDIAFVGEKGANLSGGQKARLALARWYHWQHHILIVAQYINYFLSILFVSSWQWKELFTMNPMYTCSMMFWVLWTRM